MVTNDKLEKRTKKTGAKSKQKIIYNETKTMTECDIFIVAVRMNEWMNDIEKIFKEIWHVKINT